MTAASLAEFRPAVSPRRFRHDTLVALDLLSGYGGMTQGIERAGFDVICCANHNAYKVAVHEANHPTSEHWIADISNPESPTYHSVRELPAADLLVAGVTCTNHTQANTERAYVEGLSLFDDLDDPDFESRATRSEKDRATANCVLHYADTHHPRMIIVECTTELVSWGYAVPGKKKVGDGTTYRWWLRQFENLGYRYRELRLNSMFFGVPQSRDRLYIVFWDRKLPAPNLDHCPLSWCERCDDAVEAVWSWKTGVPATGSVRYGKQYEYRCPRCHRAVVPPMSPSINALDLTNLGTKIGERKKPLAAATTARAQRCLERFAEFPAVLMPAKAVRGVERHPWQPMATQTSQQETALLSSGAIMVAAGNTYERPGSTCRSRDLSQPLWAQTATNSTGMITAPMAMAVNNFQGAARGADAALPTQTGAETLAIVSSGVLPFRKNTVPTAHSEAMPTVTADQIPGLLTAAGVIKNNGGIDEARYRAHPVDAPLGTVTAGDSKGLLFSGWYKQNGSTGTETAPHPVSDPLGTLTGRDTTAMLNAEWHAALASLSLEDCHFRMLGPHEVGRGCGFDTDFPGHKGSFIVWGSNRAQVDGYGNAVSPAVGEWLGSRCYAVLHDALTAG